LPRFTPPAKAGGIVTVALVLASRRTGVTRYPALWSSDFPHVARLPDRRATVRPPRWPRNPTIERVFDPQPSPAYPPAGPNPLAHT